MNDVLSDTAFEMQTKPNHTNGDWKSHSSRTNEEKPNRIIHTFKSRHNGKTWPTSNQYAINLYSSLSLCILYLLLAVADSLILLLFSLWLFSSFLFFFSFFFYLRFDFIAVIFTFPLFPFGQMNIHSRTIYVCVCLHCAVFVCF